MARIAAGDLNLDGLEEMVAGYITLGDGKTQYLTSPAFSFDNDFNFQEKSTAYIYGGASADLVTFNFNLGITFLEDAGP